MNTGDIIRTVGQWLGRVLPWVVRYYFRGVQFRVAFGVGALGIAALGPSIVLAVLQLIGVPVPDQSAVLSLIIGFVLLAVSGVWLGILVRQDARDRKAQLGVDITAGPTDNWVRFDGTTKYTDNERFWVQFNGTFHNGRVAINILGITGNLYQNGCPCLDLEPQVRIGEAVGEFDGTLVRLVQPIHVPAFGSVRIWYVRKLQPHHPEEKPVDYDMGRFRLCVSFRREDEREDRDAEAIFQFERGGRASRVPDVGKPRRLSDDDLAYAATHNLATTAELERARQHCQCRRWIGLTQLHASDITPADREFLQSLNKRIFHHQNPEMAALMRQSDWITGSSTH